MDHYLKKQLEYISFAYAMIKYVLTWGTVL